MGKIKVTQWVYKGDAPKWLAHALNRVLDKLRPRGR